jgi:hypothetical protein
MRVGCGIRDCGCRRFGSGYDLGDGRFSLGDIRFDRCRDRLDGLDESRWRQRGRRRLDRFGRLLRRSAALLPFDDRGFGEDVAAWQLNVALACEALDELAPHDLFDSARRALHLDAVVALEERRHLLARRVEQFRNLVDTNSGQAMPSNQMHECKNAQMQECAMLICIRAFLHSCIIPYSTP